MILFCLENKLVVALFAIFAVAVGIFVAPFDWELGGLERKPVPVDAIPDIGENQQIVFTRWMGRSPRDVDDQIGYPLTVALLGIPGVKTVRSYSMFGFSSIYVIFKDGVDFYWSRSRVLEKLNSLPAGTLPAGVQPALGPDATALGQIFWYTLEGRDKDGNPTGGWGLQELRSIQDWNVRYALLSADGVSEVASIGGFIKEYQVDVDPDAMRAHGVTLTEVFNAVRRSNIDVGARTIEVNRVEYVIRGLGFIQRVSDVEQTVVKVRDNVPILIKHIGKVGLGPALRRGALDKEGAEAVGGVIVVRYGENPLATIKHVKKKIKEIAPGLPRKTLPDGRVSQVTVVPFYDRTGLIYETLGTLNTALTEEILVTVIVVIVMVMHLRSSLLISGLLPLAVLMCFIAMKVFKVDANIVALSGIAIAIGTMVDMGIVVCENILRHLDAAPPEQSRLEVVYEATAEVASAVLTAIATTVVSFLPVFTMIAAEGKLFKPLAYTKTFALIASVIVALTVIPPFALILFTSRIRFKVLRIVFHAALVGAGLVLALTVAWWAGAIVAAIGAYHLLEPLLPRPVRRAAMFPANALAVAAVALFLTKHWMPLGPEKGLRTNLVFVACLIGGTLGFFQLFRLIYTPLLRLLLACKLVFLVIPIAVSAFGLYVWLGPRLVEGPINRAPWASFARQENVEKLLKEELLDERGYVLLWTPTSLSLAEDDLAATLARFEIANAPDIVADWSRAKRLVKEGAKDWGDFNRASPPAFASRGDIKRLVSEELLEERRGVLLWTQASLSQKPADMEAMLERFEIENIDGVLVGWSRAKELTALRGKKWGKPDLIRDKPFKTQVKWTVARDWAGRGKEFMPPLDEGSYLFMPTTMVHASIGECLDVLQKQDMAIRGIPEVDMVVGKIGRVDSPLDPAPISMIETIISYRPEYVTDKEGHRVRFQYDEAKKDFVRDRGKLIPDPRGRPYRQWREHIKKPDDIWDEIIRVTKLPGTTSAPRLQPIAARIVMLQSGMRAPMGVKVKGPDLETIEQVGLQIEKFLKQVPSVEPAAVFADRIVGKPYLEIDIDRTAIARYGIDIRRVQDVIEVAIGGRRVTTTVEGRERYPVRVRYLRELRNQIETLGRILVPAPDGTQIPLTQLAEVRYLPGPQVIKSEDTFLVGYVIFDKKPGYAEVDVVEACQRYLEQKIESGEFQVPANVSYKFAGSYENQRRAQDTLMIILPLALFVIFVILYLQFRSVLTTFIVFSGIGVAWAGGFLMLWLYAQPWFLDFDVSGVSMRELFQVHPINLSVAVWVGFLALFGIASDNGVIIATYLRQRFEQVKPASVLEVREATVFAAHRRIRPCLMTTATTVLALIPVLTSTGRGSDVMVPMAIPSFGGMTVAVITAFVVPVLYCLVAEIKIRLGQGQPSNG